MVDERSHTPDDHDDEPSALVQEASCSERVIVLKVRVPGRTSFVIVAATRAGPSGAALITSESRRSIWGGKLPLGLDRQRARESALEGARIVALGPEEAYIVQHDRPRVVRATGGRVVVTDALPGATTPFTRLSEDEQRALERRGEDLAKAVAADAIVARRHELTRALERAAARIERRRDAIRGDLEKIGGAERLASRAQWFIAEAAKAERGATKLVVTDWSTGEPVPLEIALDPSKSAKDQVAAMFKRAKRLRSGRHVAEERLSAADAQLSALSDARRRTNDAATLVELEAVLVDAKRAAPRDVSLSTTMTSPANGKSKGKVTPEGRTPYRTFFARSGRKILVGKGAAGNDVLTLHVARPHDLWLHAKDRTGAHVLVPLDRGQTCPAEDLVDAAHLAAHFSDARDETIVDIQYASRRYLRKPKGSPAGFVLVDREKVFALRTEPELLRGLLEREEIA